jgi:hypothetical protein
MMMHFSHSPGCLGEHHVGLGGSGFGAFYHLLVFYHHVDFDQFLTGLPPPVSLKAAVVVVAPWLLVVQVDLRRNKSYILAVKLELPLEEAAVGAIEKKDLVYCQMMV